MSSIYLSQKLIRTGRTGPRGWEGHGPRRASRSFWSFFFLGWGRERKEGGPPGGIQKTDGSPLPPSLRSGAVLPTRRTGQPSLASRLPSLSGSRGARFPVHDPGSARLPREKDQFTVQCLRPNALSPLPNAFVRRVPQRVPPKRMPPTIGPQVPLLGVQRVRVRKRRGRLPAPRVPRPRSPPCWRISGPCRGRLRLPRASCTPG